MWIFGWNLVLRRGGRCPYPLNHLECPPGEYFKNIHWGFGGAGEAAQQLIALAALVGDLGSLPSTHIRWLTPVPGNLMHRHM